MEETITITKLDYDLLIGQNKKLLEQNLSLQEQLLKEMNCAEKVLTAYCSLIRDIVNSGTGFISELKKERAEVKS